MTTRSGSITLAQLPNHASTTNYADTRTRIGKVQELNLV